MEDLKVLTIKEAEEELFLIGTEKEEFLEEIKKRIEEVVGRMDDSTTAAEIDAVKKYAEARSKLKMKKYIQDHDAREKVIAELANA